jgi:hypothetical protein
LISDVVGACVCVCLLKSYVDNKNLWMNISQMLRISFHFFTCQRTLSNHLNLTFLAISSIMNVHKYRRYTQPCRNNRNISVAKHSPDEWHIVTVSTTKTYLFYYCTLRSVCIDTKIYCRILHPPHCKNNKHIQIQHIDTVHTRITRTFSFNVICCSFRVCNVT